MVQDKIANMQVEQLLAKSKDKYMHIFQWLILLVSNNYNTSQNFIFEIDKSCEFFILHQFEVWGQIFINYRRMIQIYKSISHGFQWNIINL